MSSSRTDILQSFSTYEEEQQRVQVDMKNRKRKIRKVMIFMNNLLNDTEKDFMALQDHFKLLKRDVRTMIDDSSHSKSPRKSRRRSSNSNSDRDVIVPETQHVNYSIIEPESFAEEDSITVIPETVSPDFTADSSEHSDDDITELPTRQGWHENGNDEPEIVEKSSKDNLKPNEENNASKLANSSLSDETYQLINDLIGGNDSKMKNNRTGNGNSQSDNEITFSKSTETTSSGEQDQIDGAASPLIIKAVHVVNDDETFFQPPKSVWPIGYKKKSQGALIVEPADGKPAKSRRQTKLDGFLAKPSHRRKLSQKQSDQVLVSRQKISPYKSTDSSRKSEKNQSEFIPDQSLDLDINIKAFPKPAERSIPKAQRRTVPVEASFDELPPSAYKNKRRKRDKETDDLDLIACKHCQSEFRSKHLPPSRWKEELKAHCDHLTVTVNKPPLNTPPNYWKMSFMSTIDSTIKL